MEAIDCRSEEGITIGLIDSLITIVRVLKPRLASNSTKAIQEAIKDLSLTSELLEVVNKEFFQENKIELKHGQREFKEGTILTNGKQFIKLTYKHERDWTPTNNYGRKIADYWGCTFYNITDKDNEWYHTFNEGKVAGLWLQKDYTLFDFKPINAKLIHPKIIESLNEYRTKR